MRNISDIYFRRWFLYNPSIHLSKGGRNSQHPQSDFHKENPPHKKLYAGYIANIYVSIFSHYLQLWRLIYVLKIYIIFYAIFFNIRFKNIMMKSSDIYVRLTGCIFPEIRINRRSENSQHYMLDLPVFNEISIYTYK